MPRVVKDILGRLALVGAIPSGYKLNTKTGSYADASSYIHSAMRTFNGEKGSVTYDYIDSTITDAVKIAKEYPKWRGHIREKVLNLEDAIRNQKFIYSKSPVLAEAIGTLLFRITPDAFDEACPGPNKTEPRPIAKSLEQGKPRSAPSSPPVRQQVKPKRRIAASVPSKPAETAYNPANDPYNDSDTEINCDGADGQNLTQSRLELSED